MTGDRLRVYHMLQAYSDEDTQVVLIHTNSIRENPIGISAEFLKAVTSANIWALAVAVILLITAVYVLQQYFVEQKHDILMILKGVYTLLATAFGQGEQILL